MSDSTLMRCPTCEEQTLETLTFHQGKVERCPTCSFFLIEQKTLAALSEDRTQFMAWMEEAKSLLLPTARFCPRCYQKLSHGRLKAQQLILTVCAACQSLWIDFRTLRQLDEKIARTLQELLDYGVQPAEGQTGSGLPKVPRISVAESSDDQGVGRMLRGAAEFFNRAADNLAGGAASSSETSSRPRPKKPIAKPTGVVYPTPVAKAAEVRIEPPAEELAKPPASEEVPFPSLMEEVNRQSLPETPPILRPEETTPQEPVVTPPVEVAPAEEPAPIPPPEPPPIPVPAPLPEVERAPELDREAPSKPARALDAPPIVLPLEPMGRRAPEPISPAVSSSPPPPVPEPAPERLVAARHMPAPAPTRESVTPAESKPLDSTATLKISSSPTTSKELPAAKSKKAGAIQEFLSLFKPARKPSKAASARIRPQVAVPGGAKSSPPPPAPDAIESSEANLPLKSEPIVEAPVPVQAVTAPPVDTEPTPAAEEKPKAARGAKPKTAPVVRALKVKKPRAPFMDGLAAWLPRVAPVVALIVNALQGEDFDSGIAALWMLVTWSVATFVRLIRMYPFKAAGSSSVKECLERPRLTRWQGIPVQWQGRLSAGEAVKTARPPILFSDGTASIPLNLYAWWEVAPRLFGVSELSRLMAEEVSLKGWFRGGVRPYLEVGEITAGQTRRKAFTRGLRWAIAILVLVVAIIVLLSE